MTRQNAANIFDTAARLAFAAMLVALPLRGRIVIASRPLGIVYRDYTDFIFFASDAFLLLTLAAWTLSLVAAPRRVRAGPLFIAMPLAGLTALAIVSIGSSFDPALSLYHSLRLILLAGLYIFLVNENISRAWIISAIGLQIVIQSIVGLRQIGIQHSLGLSAWGELELDPAWSGVSIVFSNGIRILRAYGLTDHPNLLGGVVAFGLVAIAAAIASARNWQRAFLLPVFLLGTLILFFTFSRAAWLAFAIGIAFLAWRYARTNQTRALRVLFLFCLAASILIAPFAWQSADAIGMRVSRQDAPNQFAIERRSLDERAALNAAANTLFAEHPLTGVGIGALPVAMSARFPNFDFYYQPAHVVLLNAAAETGILGALFYFALMVAPWIAMRQRRARNSSKMIGPAALLLAITLVGFFDYYSWLLAPGRLWQWIAWGWFARAYRTSEVTDA